MTQRMLDPEEVRAVRRTLANYFTLELFPLFLGAGIVVHGFLRTFTVVVAIALAVWAALAARDTKITTGQAEIGGLFLPVLFLAGWLAPGLLAHSEVVAVCCAIAGAFALSALARRPLEFYREFLLPTRTPYPSAGRSISLSIGAGAVLGEGSLWLAAAAPFFLDRTAVILALLALPPITLLGSAVLTGQPIGMGLSAIVRESWDCLTFYVGYSGQRLAGLPGVVRPKPRAGRQIVFFALVVPLFLACSFALRFGVMRPEALGLPAQRSEYYLASLILSVILAPMLPFCILAATYFPAFARLESELARVHASVPPAAAQSAQGQAPAGPVSFSDWLSSTRRKKP